MPGFPAIFQLSDINGSNGFRLDGGAENDYSGWSVSAAGDVNGDGFDDLIVGAALADPNGTSSGSSYVVFGRAGGFAASINLGALDGTDGFRLDGSAAYDFSGFSVSGAGDVNGDGFDDLIIGAPYADPNDFFSGASYVVFGKAGGFAPSIALGTLDGTNGFRLDGVAGYDVSGYSVSGAGDVNGDGFDDLIVGAPKAHTNGSSSGATYVVFGKAGGFAPSIQLGSLDGTDGFRLDGAATGDASGMSVSGAGDVNGDGFDDLIIGAPNADANGSSGGSSYVVFGKAGGFAPSIQLGSLDGTDGFRLDGAATGDASGMSVSGAGDVNGDGFDDLIIGAELANSNAVDSGSSYVVFGKAGGFAPSIQLGSLDGTDGFRLDGLTFSEHSGNSVKAAGDVNGDGFADLIVGAVLADPNGSDSGASYVVFGKAGGFAAAIDLHTLDGTNGFQIHGAAAGDRSGYSVSGAGDVNGDGFDDLIVSARQADPNGPDSGASYVIFGRATGTLDRVGTDGADVLSGGEWDDIFEGRGGADHIRAGAGDDRIHGGQGADTLDGGAGNDLIFGGSGNDTIVASRGVDTVDGGSGNDVLDLAAFATGVTADLAAGIANLPGAGNRTLFSSIERLYGGAGADSLTGDGGANRLAGGGGADTIIGGGGADTLAGGDGDDRLNGQAGADRINGGGGRDVVIGGGGNDRLNGQAGADRIDGGAGSDVLSGGGGNDRLAGRAGADTLDGGAGNDLLTGNAGADTFVFAPGGGRDTIADFQDGLDLIDLTGFGFASVAEARSFAANDGGDVVFTFAGGEVLVVEDIAKNQHVAADILV